MRISLLRWARFLLLLVIVFMLVAAGVSVWREVRAGTGPTWLEGLSGPPHNLADRHIGIVVGHSGNDSGAVCPDGLTEAGVNRSVAAAVARDLQRRGATTDLLDEFDDRLGNYRADALISIHADSCDVNLSGFKVAGQAGGGQTSVQLVECMWEEYRQATGLAPNPDTITSDMRNYHAFREIAPETPAAIIEVGFLKSDRFLLTRRVDRVAAGIVRGLVCFLVF